MQVLLVVVAFVVAASMSSSGSSGSSTPLWPLPHGPPPPPPPITGLVGVFEDMPCPAGYEPVGRASGWDGMLGQSITHLLRDTAHPFSKWRNVWV